MQRRFVTYAFEKAVSQPP